MNYDLTTKEGFSNAEKALLLFNPALYVGIKIFKTLFKSVPSAEEQREAAIKLIEEGKKTEWKVWTLNFQEKLELIFLFQ